MMIKKLFSPLGQIDRNEYLLVLLTWLFGTYFLSLLGDGVRAYVPFEAFYLGMAVLNTALAWPQICAIFRRASPLTWGALLASPWVVISFWPLFVLFFRFPRPLLFVLAAYAVASAVRLIYVRGNEALRIEQDPSTHSAAPYSAAPYSAAPFPAAPYSAAPFQAVTAASVPTASATLRPFGWLIALDGKHKGRQYRLEASPAASGVLPLNIAGGPSDLLQNFLVRYNVLSSAFQVSSHSPSARLNGMSLASPATLTAYDRIQFNADSFIFVPLCGRYHQWESSADGSEKNA